MTNDWLTDLTAMTNHLLKNVRHASLRVWGLTRWLQQSFGRSQELWMLCFYEVLRNYYRVFKLKFFSLFFSLCFFCVHYFSFAILTIIRTTNWQRAHINKASNINKIINCNYEIMAKSRYDAILNFPKNYLISSYLGVTLSSCNIQDNFCFI